jgi:uncharacterized RDD family membrane protein YckC
MITTSLPIETPEGITFTYELASLTDRGWAYLIDLLVRAVGVLVVGVLVLLMLGPAMPAGIGLWLIVAFLVEWGYYVAFEMLMGGQSLGKRLLALRVVKVSGHPIGFYDSVLRNLLRAADIIPFTYATGALSMLATRRFQRLGDLAAGTVVIQERKPWFGRQEPQIDLSSAQPSHRQVVLSNRERRMLAEFLRRRGRLHPDRQEQIAEILAAVYQKRFNLPAEQSATTLLEKLVAAAMSREVNPT